MKIYFNILKEAKGLLKFCEIACAAVCIASATTSCFQYFDVNLSTFGIFVSGTFIITSSITLLFYLFFDEKSHKPYLEAILHAFASVLFLGLLIWTRVSSSEARPWCFEHYMDISVSATLNVIAYGCDSALAIRTIHGFYTKKARFFLVPVDGKGTSFSIAEQFENNEVQTVNNNQQ